jgi:hypothetical protein
MVFVPALPYETVCGPIPLAVIGTAPIPNVQLYVAPAAAEPVNVTVALLCAQTGLGFTLNDATGAALTVTVVVVVLLHAPLVTVSDNVFVPAVLHETACGPAVFAVAGLASEPKSHK